MSKPNQQSNKISKELPSANVSEKNSKLVKKGPLSFLSGSISSLLFAWLSLSLSKKVVIYFSLHSPNYTSPIAQSIALAMKTLIIGTCFLATFTFSFIGLGLFIVFIRSLFDAISGEDD